ncbi:MAG TPA: sulfite exporter TauE/SafE family protein, partial [Ornithinibacter sp.]|nr:sulfite exporter TauE/SafE family protein [Ornithinibacter sp.]
DGALGMGFGPTSSTILLSAGLTPATASTTVNLAKVATGLVAGASHWRFGNIDRPLVLRLAIPGAIGALVGTTVLVSVDGDDLRPVLAVVLLLVGIRILLRFSRPLPLRPDTDALAGPGELPRFDAAGVEIAAGAGGVTNGLVGAWGPVVTPFLLHRGLEPRFAVGSVNTAEVAVAVVAAGSLITSLGGDGLEVGVVLAMLTGGMLAAPLAAYVVRYIPARALGLAVAGLLLCTQARELATFFELGSVRWLVYAGIGLALLAAALRPQWAGEREWSRAWRIAPSER